MCCTAAVVCEQMSGADAEEKSSSKAAEETNKEMETVDTQEVCTSISSFIITTFCQTRVVV